VQPSSLIFLILIGIWAAYLLQHWIRRREHLATARSVDRFSDAMRVLERRSPRPELDLSAARPRSYAISPARPSRPEVVVKRAHSVRPDVPTGILARRVRGLSLLTSLSLALVVTPLVVFSLLPWWSVPGVVAALMADVTWLRHSAVSERAAGRAQAQRGKPAAGPARPAARHSAYFDVESDIDSGYDTEVESAYDAEAPAAGAREVSQPIEPHVEADLSGWAPVPVPPPTYTLKAKAADPVTAPAKVTESENAERWSLDGMVYDCDLDELVERRSATGA